MSINNIEKLLEKYNIDIENLDFDALQLDELLYLKKEVELCSDDIFVIDCLNDTIKDNLDYVSSLEELKKYKNLMEQYKLDTSYINKLINRNKKLTCETLEHMDKEDVEYLIFDGELSLTELLFLRKNIYLFQMQKWDIECLDEQINEELDDIDDLEELKKIRNIMEDYGLNIRYINKLICTKELEIDSVYSSTDSLFSCIENMPIEVLENVRAKKKIGEDTSIIDKAIANKKNKNSFL